MLGIKKNKKSRSADDGVNDVRPWEPKDIDNDDDGPKTPPKTILVMEETASVETADVTNPNTPLSNGSCNNEFQNIEIRQENLTVTPSNGSSTGRSSNGPFIFSDTDDESDLNDENNKLQNSDKEKIEPSIESIQTKVEQELNRLDEKLRTQKAERRAVAEQQLETALAKESAKMADATDGEVMKSQNVGVAQTKHSRFLFLAFLLLPIAFIMNLFAKPYNHDNVLEQARSFFGTPSGMKGITVVLSETKSKLGSTIGHRFTQLGATVTSLQDDIDCSDLNSVSTAVDSILAKHGSIDYLIQTGNLCLEQSSDSIQALVSLEPTAQGHDSLVGGTYLSAFMLTQKVLPKLEKSKHGTLVQFTSKTSSLANKSNLQSGIESLPPSIVFPGREVTNDILTQLFYLPYRFAYVKLFESIQHGVISRAYPNVRTLEISRGWVGIGEAGADAFFDRIFQEDQNIAAFSAIGDEDLQDNIYEWSQNAVWKWVASPTSAPIAEMILGNTPTQQALIRSEQTSPSASVTKYIPASATTVITSGALALLAMKSKTFSWGSGASWFQSE